jgi:hypothetical protein
LLFVCLLAMLVMVLIGLYRVYGYEKGFDRLAIPTYSCVWPSMTINLPQILLKDGLLGSNQRS